MPTPDKSRTRRPKGDREKSVTEISAGGIVFKRTPNGVRLALIRDPYGKWSFAKGHQEAGESLKKTALREVREEMGLGRLKVIRSLGRIDFWFRDRYRSSSTGRLIHKFVHYYLMEAPARARGMPQAKEKISRLIWTTPERARRLNGYGDTVGVLNRALKEIGRLVNPVRTENHDKPGRQKAP
jgi:ADP-ribose pyrophosphatase YjhB (NUDIX family)